MAFGDQSLNTCIRAMFNLNLLEPKGEVSYYETLNRPIDKWFFDPRIHVSVVSA